MAHSGSAALDATKGPGTNRSLFVDEDAFLEQFLSCSMCNERYNLKERAPKLLPCNHTFCLSCLLMIYDYSKEPLKLHSLTIMEENYSKLKCPMCRKANILICGNIKELPNDHRVVQMMDLIAQTVEKSQQVCMKHERQPANFFCKKCLMPICRDCTVVDHKEMDGHTISDISKAMRENLAELIILENKSRAKLDKLNHMSDALVNASKRLDGLNTRIKIEIEKTFKKRQEYLSSKVTDMTKEQLNKIQSKFNSVRENSDELQRLYDDFKSSRADNDILKIFSLAQKIMDGEEVFSEMASFNDIELFHPCEFDFQSEADISDHEEIESIVNPSLTESITDGEFLDLDEDKKGKRSVLQPRLRAFSYEETFGSFMQSLETLFRLMESESQGHNSNTF